MAVQELIKGEIYRNTPFKVPESVYLEFSHFHNPGRIPYCIHVSGKHSFNEDVGYVVIPRDLPLYKLDPNEATF